MLLALLPAPCTLLPPRAVLRLCLRAAEEGPGSRVERDETRRAGEDGEEAQAEAEVEAQAEAEVEAQAEAEVEAQAEAEAEAEAEAAVWVDGVGWEEEAYVAVRQA